MADRHRIRKPIEPPSERFRLSEAERQEQLDMLCPPPRAPMPDPLTIDQLRVWLEQREREASEAVREQRINAFSADRSTKEGRREWDLFTIANARWNLYRELLDAIETGVLPE